MILKDILVRESTQIPEYLSIDDVMKMFDAAKRGVGLVNKLKNPIDKKRHASQVFKNLNKIRSYLLKMVAPLKESNSEYENIIETSNRKLLTQIKERGCSKEALENIRETLDITKQEIMLLT